MGRKVVVCCAPFRGELSPHLTQCGLDEAYVRTNCILIHPAVWPQQTWTENWEGCAIFTGEGAGSPHNTMWPGPRPTCVPNGILFHPAVWPQQTWAEKSGAAVPLWGSGVEV